MRATWLDRMALVAAAMLAMMSVRTVFIQRDHRFTVEGKHRYAIEEFGGGTPVHYAFLMPGEGLHTVQVRLDADRPTAARVHAVLWRGLPDVPASMSRAFESELSAVVMPGGTWVPMTFPRDRMSLERWYTVELTLVEPLRPVGQAGRVTLLATGDNPDSGGILIVGGVRQTGSLRFRAERTGRTIYRQFRDRALPELLPLHQHEAVQAAVLVGLIAAFATLVWVVRSELPPGGRPEP